MELIYSIVGFFVAGGPFMYPILIVFAVGTAIAIERWVTLTLLTLRNQQAWSKVQPALANGDFEVTEMSSIKKQLVAHAWTVGGSKGTVTFAEEAAHGGKVGAKLTVLA